MDGTSGRLNTMMKPLAGQTANVKLQHPNHAHPSQLTADHPCEVTPSMDFTALIAAIAAVEAAQTGLAAAGLTQSAAQTKFEAATLAKAQADADQMTSNATFNDSLDVLIAAATAAKSPSTPIVPVPVPDPTPEPIVPDPTVDQTSIQ